MKFKLIIDREKDETVVVTAHCPSSLTEEIEKLVTQHSGTDRIQGYGEDDTRILRFSQIACITVQDGKTYAVDEDGAKYRLKQRLYELEAMLPASFIRINKSAIANETLIQRFAVGFGGAVDAVFRGGYREYVSRRCFAEIKRRYDL